MLVLGIESSCDETGAALVRDGRYLLSNVVASQVEIHNRYGGVVPEVASRQQLATIIPVIETAMGQAACSWDDVDAIAATYGDGDWSYRKGDPIFPLICLVISGAHSELVLVRDHGQYELLGRTRDDAAGEAFDKVSRILGLGYPGGPAIQKAALQIEEELQQQKKPLALARSAYRLPRAWLRGTYDFSFSGLKTAMLHLAEGASDDTRATGEGRQVSQYTRMGTQAAQKGAPNVAVLASSFQEAIVDVLAVKTRLAAQEYHVKQVILAGGVAANTSLRARLEQELLPLRIRLSYPPIEFCTDNAAMIGSAAFFHLCRGEQHGLDLDVEPGLSLPFRK